MSPLPLAASLQNKANFLSTNLTSSSAFQRQAAGPTFANRFWRQREAVLSRYLAPGGFSIGAAAMTTCQEGCEEPRWPQEEVWEGYSQQLPKPLVSGILPASPLLSTGCTYVLFLGGIRRHLWTSWRVPRPSKFSSVRLATSLLSLKCYVDVLPVGSDVFLMWRPVCIGSTLREHWLDKMLFSEF